MDVRRCPVGDGQERKTRVAANGGTGSCSTCWRHRNRTASPASPQAPASPTRLPALYCQSGYRYNVRRMKRLLVAVLAIPLLVQAQTRPRKIFISVDMEGISGVVQPAQLGPDGFEYQRAREWMTGGVNAAIRG